MIAQLRNSAFVKLFWGLMGLYLFNISIDSSDPFPQYVPEKLSFNDQESLVEVLIEKVMGFGNVIPEYDDHDTEDHNKKKFSQPELFLPADCLPVTRETFRVRQMLYPDPAVFSAIGHYLIFTPPPKS